MHLKPIISTVLLLFSIMIVNGQGKLFVENFLPADYPGNTQNWSVKTDSKNVIWFGNQGGLMSFNGNKWHLTKTPQRSTIRSIGITDNGQMYAGAIGDFGIITRKDNNAPEFNSLRPKIQNDYQFTDVWSTTTTGDTVLFLTDNYLFIYNGDSINAIPKNYNFFYLAHEIEEHCIVQQIGGGLFKYQSDKLHKIQNSSFFSQLKVHGIFKLKDQFIIGTKNNGLFSAQFSNKFDTIKQIRPFQTTIDQEIKKNTLYKAAPVYNNLIGLATTQAGLYVIKPNGKLIYHFNVENQLLTDAVYDFACTPNGSLWLAQDMGVSLIEIGLPVSHYDYQNGIKGTVNQIERFQQNIYVNTGFGTFRFNSNAKITDQKFQQIKNLDMQTWGMLKTKQNNKKALFVAAAKGIYRIYNKKAHQIFKYPVVYTIHEYTQNPDYIFAGTRNSLLLLKKNKNQWQLIHQFGSISQQVRDIAEDNKGNIWIAVNYKGYIRLSQPEIQNLITSQIPPVLEVKDTTHGLASLRDIQFQKTPEKLFFIAPPNTYTYNKTNDHFELLHNKQKPKYTQINGKTLIIATENDIKIDSTTLKRLPFSVTNDALIDSNEAWIGTENGVYRFRYTEKPQKFSKFDILLNQIKTGKHKWNHIYNEPIPVTRNLSYQENSICVSVSIPFYYNYQQNKISFYLEGFDEEFEPWHKQFQKNYTNLPPGEYTLYARAKNTFNTIIKKKLLHITIEPPIYRTTGAYILYILLWIIIMIIAIRYRTQKLRKSHDKLEAIIQDRTKELLNKNEEVMQVANLLKKNNKKLEELSIVAEKAGNAVAIFDKHGKLDYCNKAFENLYGYTIEAFRKEKGNYLFENSEYPQIRKAFHQCLKTKQSVQYEYFTLSKKHEGLWIHTTLTPVFNAKEQPEQFIAIDTNITQLKNAEEEVRFQKEELERKSKELADKNQELQKLSIIARETDNAVILTDKEGSLLWVNEGFTRLYGFTLEELKKEKENVFTMSSNQKIKDYIINWPENKSSITYESQNPTKNGHKIWAQTTLTPIRDTDKHIKQIIAIDSDITALKKAETQIEKQRDQLKTLNATKDKFFSIIGHDLRSPFGNFVNMTNIIMQNITNADTQTLLNYVSKLHRSAQNSYNLLENLLDWARHQQGRIKYYPDFDDITAVVEEMTELLLPLAERKKIELLVIYDEPIYAYFDEHMIKTVVRNLLFNALKFTPSEGHIKLYFVKDNQFVKVFIKDSGIGISKEARKKIFRTDTHFSTLGTDKERGTGLGLILSKDFVEMNGGTISVESEPGKGSTFIISIPAKPKD